MKTKLLYILGAVFIAAMGILAFYGISTHKEAGFMQVCWKEAPGGGGGYALAHPDKECKDPVPLQWEKNYPLRYAIHLNEFVSGLTSYERSVIAAAKQVNDRLGFTVLQQVKQTGDEDILIKWGPPAGRSAESTTFMGKDGKIQRSVILLRSPTTETGLSYIVMHAFGHAALCLDHDDFTKSIMYPSNPPMEITIEVHFTDHDVKIVKERHGSIVK
jgi:hypothetical protein